MALKWLNFPLLIRPRRLEIASNGFKYDQKLSALAPGKSCRLRVWTRLLRPDAVVGRRFAAAGHSLCCQARARRCSRRPAGWLLALAVLLRSGPIRSMMVSTVGRDALVCASRALRMAARCANEVPQQPRTILAPLSTASRT